MRRHDKCGHDGKGTYHNWRRAARAARRLPEPSRVYWCPHAGGYHLTRYQSGEYDRHQATKIGGKEKIRW